MEIYVHSNKIPAAPYSIWDCRVNRSCKVMTFHYNVLVKSVFKQNAS